jgi:glutamate formiminotransferase/formiminotetrahydrofolate cyclodeaminase
MRTAHDVLPVLEAMVETGNPNSVTDAAVGALCIQTAVMGAYLNVRVNAQSLADRAFSASVLDEGAELQRKTQALVAALMGRVDGELVT